jgi:hypothetical protein
MVSRVFSIFAATAAVALTSFAQAPPQAPIAYTVTTQFEVTGTVIRKTYRLGSKVLVEVSDARASAASTRTLYNLETMKSVSWRPVDPSAPCNFATFSPQAWQDPFEGGADLAMKDVKQTGTENLHGVETVILESDRKPGFRLWVDPRTGLMWKSEFTAKQLGKTLTYFEVTDVSLTPPAESVFDLPSHCRAAGAGSHAAN